MTQSMQANFSTLILSLASSATMALGLIENPVSKQKEKDLDMAQFNIDLIVLLQDKTMGNLDEQEAEFLKNVISDLQMKYLQAKNQ
jgi:hypothetical protein